MQIHFITIKIGIVWFCVADIHAKCVALLHYAHNVTHHTHSMKRGLTVKQDAVAIHHVTVHYITVLKYNRASVHVSQ